MYYSIHWVVFLRSTFIGSILLQFSSHFRWHNLRIDQVIMRTLLWGLHYLLLIPLVCLKTLIFTFWSFSFIPPFHSHDSSSCRFIQSSILKQTNALWWSSLPLMLPKLTTPTFGLCYRNLGIAFSFGLLSDCVLRTLTKPFWSHSWVTFLSYWLCSFWCFWNNSYPSHLLHHYYPLRLIIVCRKSGSKNFHSDAC